MTGKNKTQKWREVYGYDFASKLGDTSDVSCKSRIIESVCVYAYTRDVPLPPPLSLS